MGEKLRPKGGGWYFREDGTTVQLSKKAIEAGGYEVVAELDVGVAGSDDGASDSHPPAGSGLSGNADVGAAGDVGASAPPPPPPPPSFEGLDTLPAANVPEETGNRVEELQPLPGTQLPIGPYAGYAYVTTPYGEFGVPAGMRIVAFKEVRDWEGKLSYRAVYEGKPIARTPEQRRAWAAQVEAERLANAEAGGS